MRLRAEAQHEAKERRERERKKGKAAGSRGGEIVDVDISEIS